MDIDTTSMATALVLGHPGVVVRNAPLSVLAIFVLHAKMHGALSAFASSAYGFSGILSRALVSTVEGTARIAARGADKAVNVSRSLTNRMLNPAESRDLERILGPGSAERAVDGWIDFAETKLAPWGLNPTQERIEVNALGIANRKDISTEFADGVREARKSKERADNGDNPTYSRFQQIGASVSAVLDRVGMGQLDVVVNMMALQFAKRQIQDLKGQAYAYGKLMKVKHGGKPFEAGG